MKEQLQSILNEVKDKVHAIEMRAGFEAFKATISGPNGKLTAAMKRMKDVPKEERPAMGQLLNQFKVAVEAEYGMALERLEKAEIAARLGPAIDPTLPTAEPLRGSLHPLTQARRRIEEAFGRVGFTVAEGPEVETEWFCFDALNTPDDHPARDAQDTLFIPEGTAYGNVSAHGNERYLLRTHTSSVQIRTLLAEKPPLRIIAPGRVFRRDTVDATHSANFHQVEGLYVDRKVAVTDLKALLDYFVKEILGEKVETRMRPSFFPFTEPSFEMDIRSPNLGRLSGKWIEIMGCGMVDPKVFEAVGMNPDQWQGYAFGIGIERITMIALGIDDIRYFYQNDLRFLRQFAGGL